MAYELLKAITQCSKSNKEMAEDQISEDIKQDFENMVNYYEVNKNMDYDTDYKVVIRDLETYKNPVPQKKLVLYPYDDATSILQMGDYINWNYDGVLTDWMIVGLNAQYNYNVTAKILKCNNDLRRVTEDGAEISYPCVVIDKFNENDFDYDNKMNVLYGNVQVYVQINDDTEDIQEDERFILNDKGFRVRAINKYYDEKNKIMSLIMNMDGTNKDDSDGIANVLSDDFELSINADDFEGAVSDTGKLTYTLIKNDEVYSREVEWSSSDENIATIDDGGNYTLIANGSVTFTCAMANNTDVYDTVSCTVKALPVSETTVVINPHVAEILQNREIEFNVYKYIDNVIQVDDFTITTSGVPDKYYELTVVDGNNFRIKNLLRYTESQLTISCVSNVDASSKIINIDLGGLW